VKRDGLQSLNATDSALLVSMFVFSFQRPLLVILDRNMDLATPFHHTWTYQALVHDVLVRLFHHSSCSIDDFFKLLLFSNLKMQLP